MRAALAALLTLAACGGTSGTPTAPNGATAPSVAPPVAPYDRSEWGRWRDDDHDCQDTRQEVLIEESETPVTFETERQCRVAMGRWRDPYSGELLFDPRALEIDHVVSLKEAHEAGGYAWPRERKREYFNDLSDPDHLMAVSRSSNRSKGARGPDRWLPQDPTFRCEYLKRRTAIYSRWGLQYDCALYLRLMSEHCR